MPRAGSALPAIHAGALPQLEWLYLRMHDMRVPLPPSWGSSPAVLPRLQALALHLPFTGGLPLQWADGFPRLEQLIISSDAPNAATPDPTSQPSSGPLPAAPPTRVRLPAEWARGFARLTQFQLLVRGVEGTLDDVWPSAFPALIDL